MITVLLVIYAFMSGAFAEYTHTRLKQSQSSGNIALSAIMLGILWPCVIIGWLK
ncbi:hypothetical protein AI2642V1_1245 [Citrobacter freundii]|nr:hypothetical protein AI2642V1_1245 [Citrobacter freundii]CAH3403034.1 hypothetical protein AI2642V1_1245 [Citrobacter freundii]